MLPYLKPKSYAGGGVIIEKRKPDVDTQKDESDHQVALKAVASDLIDGVHSKDEQKVIAALHAAFEIYDAMPHVEGEHLDEDQE